MPKCEVEQGKKIVQNELARRHIFDTPAKNVQTIAMKPSQNFRLWSE
jgi:hypothetical protein